MYMCTAETKLLLDFKSKNLYDFNGSRIEPIVNKVKSNFP